MLSHMYGETPSRNGFILAGGKSSRMGMDKAFVEFGGGTLLERALGVVRIVCGTATIVGDPAKFSKHAAVVNDIYPGCGPLGGIHAALRASESELNLMLAVDMPFISGELLEFLFVSASKNDAIITVPRTRDGLQPLCAIYRREFFENADKALAGGHYKIEEAFSGVTVRVIAENELAAAGFTGKNFFNVNTPGDRSAAEGQS